jgi:hypothetical protein
MGLDLTVTEDVGLLQQGQADVNKEEGKSETESKTGSEIKWS